MSRDPVMSHAILARHYADLATVAAGAFKAGILPDDANQLAEAVRNLALAVHHIEQNNPAATGLGLVRLIRSTFQSIAEIQGAPAANDDDPLFKLRELVSEQRPGEPLAQLFKADALALISMALMRRTTAVFEGYRLGARYGRLPSMSAE